MSQWDVAGAGRAIAAPGRFTDDDGSPDTAIREARDHRELLFALKQGRVIVAVVSIAEETKEITGLTAEKTSDMSVVSMLAADGRRGLLAFTGLDSLRAWNNSARPVPVTGIDVARAALDDSCEALVLDVAGPRTQVVPEVDLVVLAGVEPLQHAAQIAQECLGREYGDQRLDVEVRDGRLRVESKDPALSAKVIAGSLPPRVLALVPDGVEILGA